MSYVDELKLKINQDLKVKAVINNIRTEKLAIAAMMSLSDYHIAKDKHLVVASHDECRKLVDNGTMDDGVYSTPRKGTWALLMDVDAFKYSTTIDEFRNSFSDFSKGWNACLGK